MANGSYRMQQRLLRDLWVSRLLDHRAGGMKRILWECHGIRLLNDKIRI
jgi:hypothetical protein